MGRFDTGIGSIKVRKDELVRILEHNLEQHEAHYRQARVEWRVQAIHELDSLLSEVRGTASLAPRHLGVGLPVPEEHSDDYRRVLRMLDLDTDDEVTLTEEAYRKLVDDQWEWTYSFTANTLNYTQSPE